MTDASDRIRVVCQCGRTLSVSASVAGKKAKCPHCGAVFMVPVPDATPPPHSPDPQPAPGPVDQQPAEQAEQSPAACPNCGRAMMPEARVCVECGYDRRSGKALRTAPVAQEPSKIGQATRSAGSFTLGIVLGTIGALVGAIIWAGIALITQFELGYVAWALGLLAGTGMVLGARRQTAVAGLTAAAIALAGILVAKGMIFGFLIRPYMAAEVRDQQLEIQRAYVTLCLTKEILHQRGAVTGRERAYHWPGAWEEAEQRAADMEPDEIRRKWDYFHENPEPSAGGKDLRPLRLADHYGILRGMEMGLAYDDPAEDELIEEELARYEAMSSDELDAAIEEMEAWMTGGKWDDPEYVRRKVIYGRIGDVLESRVEEDGEEGAHLSDDEWSELYRETVADVDALSADEQMAEARELEAEVEQRVAEFIDNIEVMEAFLADPGELEVDWGALVQAFFESMFSLFDIIFIVLAVITAHKLGSGRGGREEEPAI